MRVPFLDQEFLKYSMGVEPSSKLHTDAGGAKVIEKVCALRMLCLGPGLDTQLWQLCTQNASLGHMNNILEQNILRSAFDDPEAPYLPKEVLWRQKEQFSDGVGYV